MQSRGFQVLSVVAPAVAAAAGLTLPGSAAMAQDTVQAPPTDSATVPVGLRPAQSMAGQRPVSAADSGPAPARVLLADWGLEEVDEIRFGELSFAPGAPKPTLTATTLRAETPPDPGGGGPRSRTLQADSGRYALGGFDGFGINRLGGRFATFQRSPSRSRAEPALGPDGRPALALTWLRGRAGFAGLSVQLFDAAAPPEERVYLDPTGFGSLAFWIRGSRGGEQLLVKAADARWHELGDALPLGPVGSYLPGGQVTDRWELARIPLDDLPSRLDRRTLASLVLEGRGSGEQRVFLTPPVLLEEGADPPPLPAPDTEPEPEAWPGEVPRSTWIWNTEELLRDPHALEATLKRVEAWSLDQAYLQIPESSAGRPAPAHLAPLVRELSARGVASWALDGSPLQAMPQLHGRVLATVDAVVAHNAGARPGERFVGVRHDIEPYLLPGFGGRRRDAILVAYLEVVAASARRARDGGLLYGVDIPFWYDTPGPWGPEGVTVDFGGESKPVSHHLMDLADEVAVMSYRTQALGAGGALAAVQDELAYARRSGGRMLVALESEPLLDELLVRFQGEPRKGSRRPPGPGRWVAAWTVGDSVHLGLADGEDPEGFTDSTSLTPKPGRDPILWWPVTGQIRVDGAALSFAGAGRVRMERVARRVARLLAGEAGFGGIAFHHSGSLGELDGEAGKR